MVNSRKTSAPSDRSAPIVYTMDPLRSLINVIYSIFFLGTCIDLVNNYTCNCHAGFTGSNCDIKIKNCTEDSCYPNVTCFKNSEIINCGPCPFGLSGDGKNCKGINFTMTESLLTTQGRMVGVETFLNSSSLF